MAANNIPLTFRAAPLTEGFTGNLQEFADELVARLYAESTNSIAFFAAGSVNPGTNVGPWLKNDVEWYVWSDSLGQYVPQTISAEALKYVASSSAPDQTKYTFWIELDGTGKAIAIKYYSGGAWKDVYADQLATYATTTAMTAAISAAVSDINVGKGAFAAKANDGTQTFVLPGAGTTGGVIQLPNESFDPDSAFDTATSKFTAPATGYYQFNAAIQLDTTAGTPADLNVAGFIRVNGSNDRILTDEAGPDGANGRAFTGSALVYMTVGSSVELWIDITSDAAVTVAIRGYSYLDGYRVR